MAKTTAFTTSNVTVKRNAAPSSPLHTSSAMVARTTHAGGKHVGAGFAYVKHAVVSVCINSGVAATSFGAGVKEGYVATDMTLAQKREAARAVIAARKAG